MEVVFWTAVIGSGLIAVWRLLFGSSTNIIFGVIFEDAPSLDIVPEVGENIMKLVEVITVVAVTLVIGKWAGVHIVGSCVEHFGKLIACLFLGLGGTILYVIVWDLCYYIFYFGCTLLLILIAAIDEALGWLFKKL